MSDTANVNEIDPIKDFRVYLVKFQEMAGRALGDADSDIHRMARWLEGEGLNYWNSTIRKRQEILQKAEEALRFKRLYKDASGSAPSAVEEAKQVKIAKDRLNSAQEKLANVKKWSKALQKEVTLYRGGVSRFSNDVSAGVPAMVGYLGTMLNNIEKYIGLQAAASSDVAGGPTAGAVREATGGAMTRAADEAPKEDGALNPAALRGSVPAPQAIINAQPAQAGPVQLACGKATDQQAGELAKVAAGAAPGADERMVVSPAAFGAARVYVVRLDAAGVAWFLGAVGVKDAGEFKTIKTGDFSQGRPDLAELLRLPVGFIGVVGAKGVEAIFNPNNENVLQSG